MNEEQAAKLASKTINWGRLAVMGAAGLIGAGTLLDLNAFLSTKAHASRYLQRSKLQEARARKRQREDEEAYFEELVYNRNSGHSSAGNPINGLPAGGTNEIVRHAMTPLGSKADLFKGMQQAEQVGARIAKNTTSMELATMTAQQLRPVSHGNPFYLLPQDLYAARSGHHRIGSAKFRR